VSHHGNGLISVEGRVVAGGKAEESSFCVCGVAMANEPPWGFGGEDAAN
jgi:hypothetical protein